MTGKSDIALNSLPREFFDSNDDERRCFLCGNPSYQLEYKIDHFEFPFVFKKCTCGIVKQIPMPKEEFFEWFFDSDSFFDATKTDNTEIWGYYDYFKDESSRIKTSRRRYKKLRKYFNESDTTKSVMKIGPATGTMLHVAKNNGHKVRGCDVSLRFANYARTNYGVEIDHGRFEKMPYKDAEFDILLLFNVVENVPNLHEFLLAINRTVKTGGYFISNYVDMKNNLIAAFQKSKYFIYRPPICYIFDKEVYYKMLRQYGFEIIEEHRDIRYLHLEKISTLLRWKWLHKLAKFLKIDQINFPIYAYPSKIVVAKKITNVRE